MTKSAIVVAVAAEERRSIAQLIKPTELFTQVHFCSSFQEARFLMEHSHVDILCCDACTPGSESLRLTSELARLADEFDSQLVFFSHLDPDELPMFGIIPTGSHCLSYETSSSTIASLLKRLLDRKSAAAQANMSSQADKLMDQSTGVYNRFYFDAFLDQELSRSKLTGRPFALLLIEPSDDEPQAKCRGWGGLLPSIALTIKNQIRTSDLLCRIETKRLALLLPETTSINAKRVRQRIQSEAKELAKGFPLDLKIGLASPSMSSHYSRHGLLREAEASF